MGEKQWGGRPGRTLAAAYDCTVQPEADDIEPAPTEGATCAFCGGPTIIGPGGDGFRLDLRKGNRVPISMTMYAHSECFVPLLPPDFQDYLEGAGLRRSTGHLFDD